MSVALLWHRDGFFVDLVYSPDDGGWYLQSHSDDATSQIFDTESAARKAFESSLSSIVWMP